MWLEEFAAPYFVFRDEGADIALASPQGGQPPIDPKSEEPGSQTDTTERFNLRTAVETPSRWAFFFSRKYLQQWHLSPIG